MALALSNPNDRRRINLIARAVMKNHVSSPEEGVRKFMQSGGGLAFRQAVGMPERDGREALTIGIAAGGSMTKKEKQQRQAAYAKIKRAVAKAFETQGGPGYAPTKRKLSNGKILTTSYRARAAKSHAGRYLKKNDPHKKKVSYSTRFPNRKLPFGGMNYMVVHPDNVQAWNVSRQTGRVSGRYGQIPTGRGYKMEGSNRGHRIPWESDIPAAAFEVGGVPGLSEKREEQRRRSEAARQRKKAAYEARSGKTAPAASGRRRSRGSKASKNPNMGSLALTNPRFGGAVQFLGGYAVPVVVTGAAAGGVHALAASVGVTEKIRTVVTKVPVVGEFVGENLSFTLQGVIAGSVLALLAPMIGGTAGRYLALTAGGAIAFGGGIDAFNYISRNFGAGASDEDLGALALGDVSALGDLAFEGGALNGVDLGNFSFEAGSLSSEDYGQASLADAYYCGADFSGVEGQALLNGRNSFLGRYGLPPRRMSAQAGTASHLAGREGHRWGWLIKMVGWQRAQAIAALPPRKRIQVLAKLRKACVAAYNQLALESKVLAEESSSVDPELVPVSGFSAEGASGAHGASNYLGDPALFQGA